MRAIISSNVSAVANQPTTSLHSTSTAGFIVGSQPAPTAPIIRPEDPSGPATRTTLPRIHPSPLKSHRGSAPIGRWSVTAPILAPAEPTRRDPGATTLKAVSLHPDPNHTLRIRPMSLRVRAMQQGQGTADARRKLGDR